MERNNSYCAARSGQCVRQNPASMDAAPTPSPFTPGMPTRATRGAGWSVTNFILPAFHSLAQSMWDAPARVKRSAAVGWLRRWWAMVSVTAQDTLAATLVDDGLLLLDGKDGALPCLSDVV